MIIISITIKGVRPVDVSVLSVIGNARRRSLLAGSTITWEVSVALVRLNEIDGPTAYVSLKSQLQNAVNTGSFLTALKAESSSFSSVSSTSAIVSTATYTTLLVSTPSPTVSPTVIAIVPIVRINISSVYSTNLTLSTVLIKERIVNGDSSGIFDRN
jgi:hypothetical protein